MRRPLSSPINVWPNKPNPVVANEPLNRMAKKTAASMGRLRVSVIDRILLRKRAEVLRVVALTEKKESLHGSGERNKPSYQSRDAFRIHELGSLMRSRLDRKKEKRLLC